MKTKQKRLKFVAMFLLFNFLQSIFLPTVASALTSGPTAPEATSFEPVDTTDMVNLKTGDFTYNMPLLEVPGPEGGYPVSLSHHAGIKPLEDASWVGLGWSLNPGAINRIVNGYADDHKRVTRTVEDYWEGGETHSFSVGVTAGLAPGLGGSLGLSISHDTYQGFGGDVSLGISAGAGDARIGTGVSMGSSGFNFQGVTVSGDIYKLSGGGAIGVSMNINQNSASTSLYYSKNNVQSSLGVNMSSSGLKPSYSAAGMSIKTFNSNKGKISTSSHSVSLGAPITPGVFVSVGYNYTRYWMQERDQTKTYGTLYAMNAYDHWETKTLPYISATMYDHSKDNSFDSHTLLPPEADLSNNSLNTNKEMGGAMPSYDSYSVAAQGLSGQMQPHIFENGSLFNKRAIMKKSDGSLDKIDVDYSTSKKFTKKVNFRFLNDFSNSHRVTSLPDIAEGSNIFSPIWYPYNETAQVTSVNSFGYNSTNQHLEGSKHIEWFKHSEIGDNTAKGKGFINYNGAAIDRSLHPSQIGGFSITNESGVTYHYALPVYSYDEIHYSRTVDQSNGDTWNKQSNPEAYAYTWLLTSITGPDFIDKNNDGKASNNDWGYWVNFDYGKWTDAYKWRTPFSGYSKDIDSKVESYSSGTKEVYYLDAIQTRTHTALFVKDIRKDGKGITDNPTNGLLPVHYNTGKSTMKLDKVVLLNNNDLAQNANNLASLKSTTNNYTMTYNVPNQRGFLTPITVSHFGSQVLDKNDWNAVSGSLSPLRTIELNTDYSLCPETLNSSNNSNYYTYPSNNTKDGKLTLNSIDIKGAQNTSIVPPVNFEYDIPNAPTSACSITSLGSSKTISITNSNQFKVGDIVKINTTSTYHGYAVLLKHLGGTNFEVSFLGKYTPPLGSYTLELTKNPPLSLGKHDYWGFYKTDFDGDLSASTSDFSRKITEISSQNTDVWSLRSVTNSLGSTINVNYGHKEFNNIVLQKRNRLHISNITAGNGNHTIQFQETEDLADLFKIGDPITVTAPVEYWYEDYYGNQTLDEGVMESSDGTVATISSGTITVNGLSFGNNNKPTFPDYTGILQNGGGFVDFIGGKLCFGDGIRVNSITISTPMNTDSKTTKYDYSDGTISYLPTGINIKNPGNIGAVSFTTYKRAYYKNFLDLIKITNVVPAPQVMYKTTSVSNQANNIDLPGKTRYTFKVFEASMIDNTSETTPTTTVGNLKKRAYVIKDKTAQIGNLVKTEQLNAFDQVVSTTQNDYADDGFSLEGSDGEGDYATYNHQGVIEQSFTQIRKVHKTNGYEKQALVTAYKKYPSILKGTSTSINGVTTKTFNRAFDFYTGESTEVESQNSYGERFLAKSVPAYQLKSKTYPFNSIYSGMGLKVDNINNKHMLTQNAYSEIVKLDDSGNEIGKISANVITWNDNWMYNDGQSSAPVWRKHKSYVYQASRKDTDGTFQGTFQDFNWLGTSHSNWTKASEITLYNHYSKPLEVKDINGLYAATKMGYNESRVIATVANAKYNGFAYAGAEDGTLNGNMFDGNVVKSSGTTSSTYAHTGEKSLRTAGEAFLFSATIGTDVEAGSKYRASVWVYDNGTQIATLGYRFTNHPTLGFEKPISMSEVKAGDWKLLNIDFTVPATATGTIEIYTHGKGINSYFDDFRFHPLDGPMTSYVYDNHTGQLRFVLNGENFFTEYVYNPDGSGRLYKTYTETTEIDSGKRIVSKNVINYKQ